MPTTCAVPTSSSARRRPSERPLRSPKTLGVIEPNRLLVEVLVEQLRVLAARRSTASIERSPILRPRCLTTRCFRPLPGAGPHLAPRAARRLRRTARALPAGRRAAEVRRHRPGHRAQRQQVLGALAPAVPEFLRQTFVEWAGQSINESFWAGAYYRQQRAKGSSHQAALRALAFKWIRILYRCWQSAHPTTRPPTSTPSRSAAHHFSMTSLNAENA